MIVGVVMLCIAALVCLCVGISDVVESREPVLHTEPLAAIDAINGAMGDSAARDARAERTTAPSAHVGVVRTVSNHSYI